MQINSLIGNEPIKRQLSSIKNGDGLSHAYIVSGASGSGRHTLVRELVCAMMCTAHENQPCGQCAACKKVLRDAHPDVTVLTGGEKPISVEQVRGMKADAYIRPNEARRKVYILERAHLMNLSAQNAMLKLLEEGPPYAAFFLICQDAGMLLETVRSRCEQLTLMPLAPNEMLCALSEKFPQQEQHQLVQVVEQAQGYLGAAIAFAAGENHQQAQRRQSAQTLVQLIAAGDELALFHQTMLLEKLDKQDTALFLDELEQALVDAAARAENSRRLLHAAHLTQTLRLACSVNVGAAQLFSWLCAQCFVPL